eukprot:2842873-Rhodomonas_salina.1
MSQPLALPQHLPQPPRSLCANPVAAQVQMSQRLALPQHAPQPPRSLCANPVAAQVKMGQRLALPQHLHAHEPSALTSSGPTCFQRDHEMFRQAPK